MRGKWDQRRHEGRLRMGGGLVKVCDSFGRIVDMKDLTEMWLSRNKY